MLIKKLFFRFKSIVNILILSCIDFFAKKKAFINSKELIIVRSDVIGDYILFRNFLKTLKESQKFSDYKITLLGDKSWQQLSEILDVNYVDNFIWIDTKKFCNDYKYRFLTIRDISFKGYEVLINPIYSRNYLISESIVKVVSANNKIGCKGDDTTISQYYKKKANKNYTTLLNCCDDILFEFYRNYEFFENFLGEPLTDIKFEMKINKRNIFDIHSNKYAILFLGASNSFRQWSAESFAKVAKYIEQQYGYKIVICGASSDIPQAEVFTKRFSSCINLVGKTSLIELASIIEQCQLIVSNETSAVHMAAALGVKPIFVIYNGNHFGRFTPYPKELCKYYYLIGHPFIKADENNYKRISNQRNYIKRLNINEISVETVINTITKGMIEII